jgi:hypothetical protein
MMHRIAPFLCALLGAAGCASQDIPQAYRGRLFDRTGAFAFYAGGTGFTGPVLNPGTYFTGAYNEIRLVDCSMVTGHEPLTALTRDGVQFGLDVYVRFSADCSDDAVAGLLETLTPDDEYSISSSKLYNTFVKPAIGEAVREMISPYRAADLNEKREELLANIRNRFIQLMSGHERRVVAIQEVNLTHLDFPEQMVAANVDRAVQTILKDKAIAERERVQAEIETTTMRRQLSEREGDVAAVKIERIGAALHANPEYLQYDLQSKMPDIYERAGKAGNMVITAPAPQLLLPPPAPRDGAAPPREPRRAPAP